MRAWDALWVWLENSNLGGILLGLVFWSAPVTAWLHWQHRKTRAHATRHAVATHERLKAIEQKLEGHDADTP